MGLRNMFDHKYPITNLHEVDLTFMHDDIDKMISILDFWEDTINELKEGLKNLDTINSRLDVLEHITAAIPSIRQDLNNIINLHDVDVKTLKGLINKLQKEIDNIDIQASKIYIDSRDNMIIADYNRKIYQCYDKFYSIFNDLAERIIKLAEIIKDIDTKAYNPWPRRTSKENLQTNLNYAYSDLADLVPTAAEYSELNLSAYDYDIYDLKARDYSLFGRIKLKMHYVYSPTYGFKQEISNVLTSIINYIKDTLSADEYSLLDITADEYQTLDLTALDYYSYMRNSGYLALGGDGISASEYSTIHVTD